MAGESHRQLIDSDYRARFFRMQRLTFTEANDIFAIEQGPAHGNAVIDRHTRLLNDKRRTIGLDLGALDAQIRDKANIAASRDQAARKEKSELMALEKRHAEESARMRTRKCDRQKEYASHLAAQMAEAGIHRIEAWADPSSNGPASMKCFEGCDPGREARILSLGRQQAECLKQQMFEKRLGHAVTPDLKPDKHSYVDDIVAGSLVQAVKRREAQQSSNEVNQQIISANEKRQKDRVAQELPTSLLCTVPHTLQTDFKGTPKDVEKVTLLEENAALIRLKKESAQLESKCSQNYARVVEDDRRKALLNAISKRKDDFMKQVGANEASRANRESADSKSALQAAQDRVLEYVIGVENLIPHRQQYDQEFFGKRFGTSLT